MAACGRTEKFANVCFPRPLSILRQILLPKAIVQPTELLRSHVGALACCQREREPLDADASSGALALDLAGLAAAQRRLLVLIEAQLDELDRAGG